jgi:S1-C subfamily serine protease
VALAAIALSATVVTGGNGAAEPGSLAPPAVVTVRAVGCRAIPTVSTGVVVAPDLVLTVAHALAGEGALAVTTPDGRVLDARLAAIDTVADGAVLAVPGLRLGPAATVGPGSSGPALLITPAGPATVDIVRAVQITTQDVYGEGSYPRPGFELRGDIAAGDSGGAVLDPSGRLVAIAFARSRNAPDRAWATSMDALTPLLARATSGEAVPATRCAR